MRDRGECCPLFTQSPLKLETLFMTQSQAEIVVLRSWVLGHHRLRTQSAENRAIEATCRDDVFGGVNIVATGFEGRKLESECRISKRI